MKDAVDLRELLTIDLESELRKLTTAQLQGPWQLPAELVRRGVAAGAKVVEVEFGRAGAVVRDEGRPIEREQLEALMDLLDRGARAERRHQALLALEAAGALALLGLPALGEIRVVITARGEGRLRRLEFLGHGRPDMKETNDPAGARGTTVEVQGAALEPTRARGYLADVCRFTPGVVRVDGEVINGGMTGYFAGRELSLPQFRLRGSVALSHRGEQARVWLLVHGVISTHVGVARAPCFEAMVELADKITAGELPVTATAADLREAIAPALDALADAGVRLMLAIGPQVAQVSSTSQARLLHLLLQALRCRRRVAELLVVPVVPALVGHGNRCFLALNALPPLAKSEPVFVLGPEQEPDDFMLPDTPVLVLATAERGMLAELLGIRFRPAPPRQESGVPIAARVGRGLGRLWQSIRPSQKSLDEATLTPAEGHLLVLLRVALKSGGATAPDAVVLCAGRGAPRVVGKVLVLGREHPEVRAAVVAAGRGEVWAYPAAIALCGGRALPGTATRATWVRKWHETVMGEVKPGGVDPRRR